MNRAKMDVEHTRHLSDELPGTDPAPRAPPGIWRVLAPALVTWALVALAIAIPGSWWILVAAGVAFGVVASILVLCVGVTRSSAPSRSRGAGGNWWAYGAVLAALLLVTGARVGVEAAQRAAPTLEAAVESGERVEVRVRLSDFPTLDSGTPSASRSMGATDPELAPGPEPEPEPEPNPATVSGWVTATLQGDSHETPVVLWLQHTTIHDPAPGSTPIDGPDHWAPGTELLISGEPVALEPTSSAAYGIRVVRLTTLNEAPGPARFAAHLRAELRAAAAPVPGAALVPGFAVGDTALVSTELDAEMRASSLTHLVAVSGANCALVTSAAIWALSWLGCGRRVRVVAAALALVAFVGVVGPDASVQRAAIMGAVLLASSFGGKRSVALPALGIAIAVLLIADPWQAWQPGFALSVAATGGIVLCAPAFTDALRRFAKIPGWLALPIAVAAAAQLACGPLLLLLQDGLPAAGLLANVLAGPAAPVGTALGLAALVTGPASAGLANALVVAASLPARWVEETARVAAGLPGARWEWLTGVPGALLLAAVEAAAITAWLLATGRLTAHGTRVRRPWQPDARGPRQLRRWVAVLVGCAAGVFVGPTLVAPTVERAGVPPDWGIVACDVGQGDALLLRGPDARPGEAILVDTGDDETLLRDCLRLFGVTRISLLVLTHDDRDHVGAISAAVPLAEAAIIAPATRESELAGTAAVPGRPLLAQLESSGLPWSVAGSGDAGQHAGVSWEVLAPDPRVAPTTTNDASLVLGAEAGDLSMLLLADTGEESQARLVHAVRGQGELAEDAGVSVLDADVVKVAHHGSRDQRSDIYDTVGAAVGLISVGESNGYGHPARDTISALIRAGTRPLRTDELGSIAVSAGEQGPRVWAERGRSAAPH